MFTTLLMCHLRPCRHPRLRYSRRKGAVPVRQNFFSGAPKVANPGFVTEGMESMMAGHG